jgi:hypothetical protein
MAEQNVVAAGPDGKIRIISFEKFSQYAPNGEPNQRGKLAFSFRDANPRLTVFTNIAADTNSASRGIISAPMDPVTFFGFLDSIRILAMSQPSNVETSFSVDCLTSVRDESGKITDKTLLSKAYGGRDSTGVIWISIIAEGRPRIKFPITISAYHVFRKADGTELTPAEASKIATLSLIELLKSTYSEFINESLKDQIANPRTYGKPMLSKPVTDESNFLDDINM